MKFRSHILRSLDVANPWNRAILILTALAGTAGALMSGGAERRFSLALAAGGQAFLSWALARELDPDRQASAILVAVTGATWALLGFQTALLPFVGLLMAARLLVETTGRRPLVTDLGAMAILATGISFTELGWVMGFGLAIAIYIDDRMAIEHSRQALLSALAGAVGSSVFVTLSGAIPESMPNVRPFTTALLGLLALVAVVREPVDPVSYVDSRNKRFLSRDRLQAGRAVAGILIFLGALVSGEAASTVVPMAMVLVVAIGSSELERIRRARSHR